MPFISSPKATLPSAVRHGNSCAKSWNTTPRSMPWPVTALPPMRISPPVGGRKPAMMLSSVDLPQPDGPTMQRNSDCSILKLVRSARRPPGRPACHRPARRRGFRYGPLPFPEACCPWVHYARFCMGTDCLSVSRGQSVYFRMGKPNRRQMETAGTATDDKITSQMTLSERADELEEQHDARTRARSSPSRCCAI